MSNKQNVLVAGANGTTGRQIIDLLKNSSNYQPIAMIRKQDQVDYFQQQDVSMVLADLEDDLSQAVKDTHNVIFAAGSKGKNLIGVDQEGAKKLIDAAQEAGVDKFVMLSPLGADNPAISDELEDYLRAKQSADDHLRVSQLDYSIIRPGALTNNEGTGRIELSQHLNKRGEIPRADVAKTLVTALDKNVLPQQIVEILSGDVAIEEAVKSI
ncbi:MAG: SDR family oxidoreductase [Marinicella pacifica]